MNIFSKTGKQEMKLSEVVSLMSKLRLPISLVFTPVNLKEEKEKFLNSDLYEPIFKYRGVRNNNEEILKRLSSLKLITDVDPRISDFYIQLIASKNDSNILMNAVGNNELVTEMSYKKYGVPTPLLFRNASRVLRGNTSGYNTIKSPVIKESDIFHYEKIREVFNLVFEHFGLNDWQVQASSKIQKNGVKVGVKSKWVIMDPNIERSKFKLKKTLVHEVGTHVFRSVNGLNTKIEALSKPNLPKYLDIEEGLAIWNESDMNLLTLKNFKKSASFVYAIYIGEQLSFRQLYNALLAVFPKNTAFNITYRVKRGLGDTSYPGTYTKDIVYFRGFKKVKKALEKDKSLYEKLYAGKIDLKQCEWVDDGLIPKAKIVPSKQEWNDLFRKVGI